MKKKSNVRGSRMAADTRVKTQVEPQDIEPVKHRRSGRGSTWSEVEDATVVLNPDPESMDSRG